MKEKIVYLNGSYVRESEAKVSVLDYGFNAGDGVYDVTRTFGHKPFKLKEHTERLFRSLYYTRIDCGLSIEKMETVTLEVLDRNKPLLRKDEEVAIWQVVSRGVRSSGGDRVTGGATVTVYCVNVNFKEFARQYIEGVKLVIPSTRRIPPQCLESKAKITNKMNHNIAIFEAKQVDPEAIPLMLDINGNLSESNAHNIFLVLDKKLCTPTDKNVLGGITRDTLISIAKENKVEVVEADFTPYDLYNADEAFLASTSPTIVPIQSVNGVKVGKQVPGSVTIQLIKAWSNLVGVDIVVQAFGHLAEGKSLLKIWGEGRAA